MPHFDPVHRYVVEGVRPHNIVTGDGADPEHLLPEGQRPLYVSQAMKAVAFYAHHGALCAEARQLDRKLHAQVADGAGFAVSGQAEQRTGAARQAIEPKHRIIAESLGQDRELVDRLLMPAR